MPLPLALTVIGRAWWLRLVATVLSGLLTGLTRAVLAWLLTRTVLAGLAGPLSRLPRRIVTVVETRIGAAQGTLLGDDLTADGLRGVNLTHKALVA